MRARALAIWASFLVHEIESNEAAEAKFPEILALYDRSLDLARSVGDLATLVFVLGGKSFVAKDAGDVEAGRALAEEALSLARSNGNPWLIGYALMLEAEARAGSRHERKPSILEAADWFRRSGDSANLSMALLLASVRSSATLEDIREDRAINEEALELAEEVGFIAVQALLVGNLGIYCYYLGERAEATTHLRRAVQIKHRAGWPEYWMSGTGHVLAWLAADQGEFLESAQMLGAITRMRTEAPEFYLRNRESGHNELDDSIDEDVRRRSMESLGEEAYEHAVAAGKRLTTSQFVDLALGR